MFALSLLLFVLSVLVFFFKQKTAYEMRISDWSSDVCSSDLLAWADVWLAVALAPFLLAVGICPWLMRGRVDSLGSKAREVAGELAAHAVDSVQEIGRASCRDRVCQYV